MDGRFEVHPEHFDGVLKNTMARNKDAAKLIASMAVPYHEVRKKRAWPRSHHEEGSSRKETGL